MSRLAHNLMSSVTRNYNLFSNVDVSLLKKKSTIATPEKIVDSLAAYTIFWSNFVRYTDQLQVRIIESGMESVRPK